MRRFTVDEIIKDKNVAILSDRVGGLHYSVAITLTEVYLFLSPFALQVLFEAKIIFFMNELVHLGVSNLVEVLFYNPHLKIIFILSATVTEETKL